MTHLRHAMLEELQRRNYAPNTIKAYVRIIQEFAEYFHRSLTNWARSTCGSIRPTCSRRGNWKQVPSSRRWLRCASSM